MIFCKDGYIFILCFYYCVLKFNSFECNMNVKEVFKKALRNATRVVIFTGAGISAESGVPTFTGAGGWWRKYPVQDLATYDAFLRRPSLIWEFYNYRREIVLKTKPNKAHYAITEAQERFAKQGRNLTVITQNVDGLHQAAGTKNVIELHGSMLRTKCIECKHVEENRDFPICEALKDRGAPDMSDYRLVHEDLLPHCNQPKCKEGLLRPDVVWFGDDIDRKIAEAAEEVVDEAEFCLVVGSSSRIHPAAALVLRIADKGLPVAEFNTNETALSPRATYQFIGPCSITLPEALAE